MKAKTKFLKMYYKLPNAARAILTYDAYDRYPMSLFVLAEEIQHNTPLSKQALKDLRYEDDE